MMLARELKLPARMLRTLALLAPLAACGANTLPPSTFDMTITYDGTRSTGTVTFPEYDLTDPPAAVVGAASGSMLPVAELALAATGPGERTITVGVQRASTDYTPDWPYARVTIPEARFGEAVECMYTTRSCSVLLVEVTP